MKNLIFALPLLFLMACSQEPLLTAENSEVPDRVIYRTQGYYNAAVAAEIAYGKLPRCGKPTSPVLCSDLSIMKKVRKIDDAAWAAIKEAQVAVRTEGFGEGKVATFVTSATALTKAFTDITNTLPKKE